jgi:hypothetical protein
MFNGKRASGAMRLPNKRTLSCLTRPNFVLTKSTRGLEVDDNGSKIGGRADEIPGIRCNRLFMAASQSLYAVYVATQGAAPG